MKTYDVEVYREGRFWEVAIPEFDGLTQARRLSEVEHMATDWIHVDRDIPKSEIAVRVTSIRVGGRDYVALRRQADESREQLAALEAELAARRQQMARDLVANEIPLRDVGEVLGVSFQRAHQLVS